MIPFANTETITVTRPQGGSIVDYNWVEGTPLVFNITGSVQPIRGAELQRMPEGLREKELRRVYTETELFNNDTVTIDGQDYQVEEVDDYSRHGFLAHYRVIVRRNKDEQGGLVG